MKTFLDILLKLLVIVGLCAVLIVLACMLGVALVLGIIVDGLCWLGTYVANFATDVAERILLEEDDEEVQAS